MSLWGPGASLYYSGSSDGRILTWDVRRSPQDVLISSRACVGAGIQSGLFSPDGTHLLVGDAIGGVHVLSSAPWAPLADEGDEENDTPCKGAPIEIRRAPDGSGMNAALDDNPGTEGIEAANALIANGEIVIDPQYGPGRGPNYQGPYGICHREPPSNDGQHHGRLKKEVYRAQPFSRKGEIRV